MILIRSSGIITRNNIIGLPYIKQNYNLDTCGTGPLQFDNIYMVAKGTAKEISSRNINSIVVLKIKSETAF